MPSRYEPCGLNQLYSLKYGTVPVVHATGGLADTITNLTECHAGRRHRERIQLRRRTRRPRWPTRSSGRARRYANRPVWEQLIRTGMQQDWSWNHSAREYGRLYELTLARATHAVGGADVNDRQGGSSPDQSSRVIAGTRLVPAKMAGLSFYRTNRARVANRLAHRADGHRRRRIVPARPNEFCRRGVAAATR